MAENRQSAQRPTEPTTGAGALFGPRAIVCLVLLTVALLGVGNGLTGLVQKWAQGRFGIAVDRPRAWPFSVFSVRVPTWHEVVIAAAVVVVFYIARRQLARIGFRPGWVVLAGLALIIGTNLMQGWQNGFVTPTAGTIGEWKARLRDPLKTAAHLSAAERNARLQYYDDAIGVENGWRFLQEYNELQPDLRTHSQTHPPGAVLVFHWLRSLVGEPAAISLAIAVVSTALSGLFLYGLWRTLNVEGRLAGYMSFVFLVLPAVQIYYAASLDALIATALLGGLYCFVQGRGAVAVAGTTVLVIAASFLTFGWVFILPVLAGWEIVQRRSIWRFAVVCAGVGAFYLALYGASGFDYVGSLRLASTIENPQGFRLLAEPVSYVLTRLECIVEILVFLGPFLAALVWRGLRLAEEVDRAMRLLFWLGVGALLAMFAAGAFRTGETARACLFIYPYLLLPIGAYMRRPVVSDRGRMQLLGLVFGQTVLMQVFGSYFW